MSITKEEMEWFSETLLEVIEERYQEVQAMGRAGRENYERSPKFEWRVWK